MALSNTESLANGACSELASFTGAGTDDAPQLLLSLPVLVNPGVPDYTGLVIDRNAVVSAVGQLGHSICDDLHPGTPPEYETNMFYRGIPKITDKQTGALVSAAQFTICPDTL